MPRFAANLSMLFTEHSFLDRFAAAKAAGFRAVEFQFPYAYDLDAVADALRANDLTLVMFNLPAGDWQAGDRGLASDPSRVDAFRRGVEQAIAWAQTLGCTMLNCLAGLRDERFSEAEQRQTLVDNLRFAAQALAKANMTLLVEPINPFDMPGFLLNTSRQASEVLADVGMPNVKLQLDLYHMQRSEGQLVDTIKTLLPRIGHIQIADVPGRHQPGTGEINFPFVLKAIDDLGYRGYVSLEYIPDPDTERSLGWIEAFGYARGA